MATGLAAAVPATPTHTRATRRPSSQLQPCVSISSSSSRGNPPQARARFSFSGKCLFRPTPAYKHSTISQPHPPLLHSRTFETQRRWPLHAAGDGSQADVASPPADVSPPPAVDFAESADLAEIYGAQSTWEWRGQKVNYAALGSSRGEGEESSAVVFVHGFGASIGHWRKTMPVLAKDGLCRVYALDLLGLGASAKPAGFPYTIETWAEMVDDFAAEVVSERQVVFVGNSIGSLVTLAASASAASDKAGLAGRVKGVVLINCSGGLNNKAIVDDWRIAAALPIFWLIDFLLGIPPVARSIFNAVKTQENVKAALSSVYCNQESVDEELVKLILRPADDEGALGVFIAVITGPPGPRPEILIPNISCPILILWGDKDPFTPMDGPVGRYFKGLEESREGTEFVVLSDVGHCPQDDRAELVHDSLRPWLDSLFAVGS